MTNTTTLPTWNEMSDLDRGAVLLHLWKRYWEGAQYAAKHYPCRYFDDPRLTALDRLDACEHAVKVGGSHEEINKRLGNEEHDRLYELALDAERAH